MNAISKVSEISYSDVADFIRLSELTPDDVNTLNDMLGVAKAYVSSYTGLEDLDEHQDLVIVVLVLCQDMWDNRTMYVDSTNLNTVIETILGMHSVNLL